MKTTHIILSCGLLFMASGAIAKSDLDPFAPTRPISTLQPLESFDDLDTSNDYVAPEDEWNSLWGVEIRAYSQKIQQFNLNDHALTLVVSVNEAAASGILHTQAFQISTNEMLYRELSGLRASFVERKIFLETRELEPDTENIYYHCYELDFDAQKSSTAETYRISIGAVRPTACG